MFLTLSIWLFVYAKVYLVFDRRSVSPLYVHERRSTRSPVCIHFLLHPSSTDGFKCFLMANRIWSMSTPADLLLCIVRGRLNLAVDNMFVSSLLPRTPHNASDSSNGYVQTAPEHGNSDSSPRISVSFNNFQAWQTYLSCEGSVAMVARVVTSVLRAPKAFTATLMILRV